MLGKTAVRREYYVLPSVEGKSFEDQAAEIVSPLWDEMNSDLEKPELRCETNFELLTDGSAVLEIAFFDPHKIHVHPAVPVTIFAIFILLLFVK